MIGSYNKADLNPFEDILNRTDKNHVLKYACIHIRSVHLFIMVGGQKPAELSHTQRQENIVMFARESGVQSQDGQITLS